MQATSQHHVPRTCAPAIARCAVSAPLTMRVPRMASPLAALSAAYRRAARRPRSRGRELPS